MKKKKLHVAMLIGALSKGGTERVLVNLAEYLVNCGHEVTVVTQYRREEEYPLDQRAKRVISDITQKECSRSRIVNFKRRFCKLRKIWKQEKPDVILSFIGKNNMMAVLTSCFLKIPVAVAVRGEPTMEYYNNWMRFMARHLFAFADGVILQTTDSFSFFPKKIQRKAVILKNPINQSFFRERYQGEREKEIVSVGRIDANKNHEMLIRAFADIAPQYPEYRLTIYGTGELKESLEQLVKEMKMENRIFFAGAVSDVANAIYKTRVFVLPSNTEGVPNTLIEAMILGLTVIATDCPCGGPADLIQHGVNGLLTPVNEKEKMRESLQNVLNDLQKADFMGENAAKTGDIYRCETVYGEWEEYLQKLASRRKL